MLALALFMDRYTKASLTESNRLDIKTKMACPLERVPWTTCPNPMAGYAFVL
jgi:hypothetical protein